MVFHDQFIFKYIINSMKFYLYISWICTNMFLWRLRTFSNFCLTFCSEHRYLAFYLFSCKKKFEVHVVTEVEIFAYEYSFSNFCPFNSFFKYRTSLFMFTFMDCTMHSQGKNANLAVKITSHCSHFCCLQQS
jgi:hypothetical protein